MNESEVLELFNNLQEWHKNIITTLQMVVDADDDDVKIQFKDTEGKQVDLPKDEMPAFKAGISIAIELIKDFPITLKEE